MSRDENIETNWAASMEARAVEQRQVRAKLAKTSTRVPKVRVFLLGFGLGGCAAALVVLAVSYFIFFR